MQSSGQGGVKGRPGLQDGSCQVYPTNNLAIGINLLLLLMCHFICHVPFPILHKHKQHYRVNTMSTSCTSSCSSSTISSKSSSSSTTMNFFVSSSSSSSTTTDSSTSSSTTTISTSSHYQWPIPHHRVPRGRPPRLCARPAPKKKKKGPASSDSNNTLTRGRSSKQDVYFLAQGSKDVSLFCRGCPAPTLSCCHFALRTRTPLLNPSCPILSPDQHLPL